MADHRDILAHDEKLRNPLLGSLAIHAAVIALILFQGIRLSRQAEQWGDPLAGGGGAVSITPVTTIPLPARTGERNPIAADTKSKVPAPLEPQKQTRVEEPEPDAIPIKGKTAKSKEVTKQTARRSTPQMSGPARANQLYSSAGQEAVSPLFGMTPGSGGVGLGSGVFGSRFGAYALMIRDRVASRWRTGEVDPRLREAPPVIVTFDLHRSGAVSNVRVVESSGNALLDRSAQRAILEAAPFPPLPSGFERNSVTIEFWFQLKR